VVLPCVLAACSTRSRVETLTSTAGTAVSISPSSKLSSGHVVPDVVGNRRIQAEAVIVKSGLSPRIVPSGSSSLGASDRVLSQVPTPGTRVPRHATVLLRVSCVPAPCPSPAHGAIYDPCSCATT
jgi:beta-lactam-binding protein with PASTA domain